MQFPSIYAEADSSEADRSMVIRLVVKLTAEFCVTVHIVSFEDSMGDLLCVPTTDSHSVFMPSEAHVPQVDVALKNLDGSDACPKNGLITLLVTMAIQPNSPQTYGFSAYTDRPNTDMVIGKPRFLWTGSLIGAANEHITDEDTKQEVSLSSVIHDGFSGMIYGFNTINYVIPYIVRANPSTTLISKIDVSYGSSKINTPFQIKVTDESAAESGDPQCNAGLIHVLDYNVRSTEVYSDPVAPGETIRFYYDIVFPSVSCSVYTVVVQHSNDEKWPVDVGRLFVQGHGESVWCISDGFETEMQKSKNDPQLFIRGSLDLGTVCTNTGLDRWVRVAGFLRPWWKNPKSGFEGIDIQRVFSVFIEKQGTKLSSTEKNITFTVSSANTMAYSNRTFEEDYDLKIQPTEIQASPGEDVDVTVTIRLAPGRRLPNSKIILSCPKVDGQSEAQCTLGKFSLSFGTNFIGMNNEQFAVVYESEFNSFQKNKATIELGNLVETGAKQSFRLADVNPSDIRVSGRLKIADSKDTEDGSTIRFTVLTMFNSVIGIADLSINVTRNGNEKALIDFQARIVDDGRSSYSLGDTFRLNVFMAMLPDSQRKCTRRRLRVRYKPLFSPPKLIAQNSTGINFTQFDDITWEAGVFYFEESANLTLEMSVSEKPLKWWTSDIILTAELDCFVYERHLANVTRFVTTVGVNIESGALKPGILGIHDRNFVKDCQFRGIEIPNSGHPITEIRNGSQIGWQLPFLAPVFKQLRYFKIIFGEYVNVRSIFMKMLYRSNKVLLVDVFGTTDGVNYFYHETVKILYRKEDEDLGVGSLVSPLYTSGIKVVINKLSNENDMAVLTVEFYGVKWKIAAASGDPCESDVDNVGAKEGFLPEVIKEESRTYLHINNALYLCYPELDTTGRNETKKHCFVVSGDLGQIRDLGPYVSQIVAAVPSRGILLGVGKDMKSLVLSRDYGKKWISINRSAYKYYTTQSSDTVMAQSVPWTQKAGTFDPLTTGTACTEYASGPWNICFDGIYNNGNLVVDWGDSCKAVDLHAN